jgi:hypothetical protein
MYKFTKQRLLSRLRRRNRFHYAIPGHKFFTAKNHQEALDENSVVDRHDPALPL